MAGVERRTRSPARILGIHRLNDKLRESLYVILGGIEGTHPARHRLLFVPHVEKITLLDFVDCVAWNAGEHAVGLHRVSNSHLGNVQQFLFEQPGHSVGVTCAFEPETVGEQDFKLHRDETHFGRQLHRLFAQVKKVAAELFVTAVLMEEDDGLGAHEAILGSSKR